MKPPVTNDVVVATGAVYSKPVFVKLVIVGVTVTPLATFVVPKVRTWSVTDAELTTSVSLFTVADTAVTTPVTHPQDLLQDQNQQ